VASGLAASGIIASARSRSSVRYTSGVDSCPSATASTQWYVPDTSAGVSCSPRPWPTAVPPSSAKATSLPTPAAMPDSCSALSPACHSSLHATSAAAASALPPASPAATGIRLRMVISRCRSGSRVSPASWASSVAAFRARLSGPPGTEPAPSPLTSTWSSPGPSTVAAVTSSYREMAWNTVTRSW
jgi:hypothetical protein